MARHHKSSIQRWAGSLRDNRHALFGIAFADISDSTTLHRTLGAESMQQVRTAYFAQGQALSRQFNGYVVKTLGDGFLVAFHTAIDAVDFILTLEASPGDESIRLHAGIDVGPVMIDDECNDMHGDAINYAARLEAVAQRGEVVVSDSVKTHLDDLRAARHEALTWKRRVRQLKGFPRRPIWTVVCERQTPPETLLVNSHR